MYPNRIASSGIERRSYVWTDPATQATQQIAVLAKPVTPEESISLLVSEGCINVNFEMSTADFDAAVASNEHGPILRAPLSEDLIRGFKFGEPRGEFSRVWEIEGKLSNPENLVVSAKIDISESLQTLLRRAGY